MRNWRDRFHFVVRRPDDPPLNSLEVEGVVSQAEEAAEAVAEETVQEAEQDIWTRTQNLVTGMLQEMESRVTTETTGIREMLTDHSNRLTLLETPTETTAEPTTGNQEVEHIQAENVAESQEPVTERKTRFRIF